MTARVELRAEPAYADVLRVAENLRERDREELFATRYGDDPADVARDAVASGAFRWGAYLDGEPVAMIGAFPRWPGVWTAWAYGTDDWPRAVLTVTKHVKRFMLPALYRAGATRVDACAMENHTDARAWLGALGAEPEIVLHKWGKNGQSFINYIWTRETTYRVLTASGRIPKPTTAKGDRARPATVRPTATSTNGLN